MKEDVIYAAENVLAEAGGMLDEEAPPAEGEGPIGEPAEAPKRVGPAAVVDSDIRLEDLDPDTQRRAMGIVLAHTCLLYTSDAADE